MERLDKVISQQTHYTRKEVKELIKNKQVSINNQIINKPDFKVNTEVDKIILNGEELKIQKHVYLMLNKPKGYVSATEDRNMKTVLELVPEKYLHRELFPAGRLDKDTEGLMIITDDGDFAHNILSPKKHISKTYHVKIDISITEDMIIGFKNGIELNDGKCKQAILEKTETHSGIVILTEGRYHQIKRMFGCFGAKVVELKRIKMGAFQMPTDLKLGECREFSETELMKVKQ